MNGRKEDLFWGTLFGNTLGGISLGWWKHSHYVHHTTPNHFENDPDIQHLPALAIDKKMLNFYSTFHNKYFHLSSLAKFLVSKQKYLFYPLMTVARFNLYAQGLIWSLKNGSKLDKLTLGAFFLWYTWLVMSGDDKILYIYISHATTAILHVQICISHFAEQVLLHSIGLIDSR